MDLTLSQCFVVVHDPDLALTFYRDALGLEVRNDVANEGSRWITVGAASQPGVSIVITNYLSGSPADRDAATSAPTTSRARSRRCAPRAPKWSKSRPIGFGARATSPCATRPATWCASTSRPARSTT